MNVMLLGGRLHASFSIFVFEVIVASSTLATSVWADTRSIEIFAGAMTFHFVDQGSSSEFRNKLSRDGRLIYNPIYGLRYFKDYAHAYSAAGIFFGNNSVGLPMGGGMFSLGLKGGGDHLFLGLGVGAYAQDNNNFRSHRADPFKIYETKGGVGIVPVLGLEMGFRVRLGDQMYLKLYDLLTPIVNSTFMIVGCSF